MLHAPPIRAEEPERKRRDVIRPEETHGIPPGFHEESHPRWGWVITGGVMTLVGSAALAAGIAEISKEAPPREPGEIQDSESDPTAAILMILGGAHVAVGIPLLATGLMDSRTVYVRDQPSELAVSLRAGPNDVTTSLRLTF
jgi:hypothetical protein